jgi:hypothetical protein
MHDVTMMIIMQQFKSEKAVNFAITSAKTQVSVIYTISPTDPSSTRIYRSTLFSKNPYAKPLGHGAPKFLSLGKLEI